VSYVNPMALSVLVGCVTFFIILTIMFFATSDQEGWGGKVDPEKDTLDEAIDSAWQRDWLVELYIDRLRMEREINEAVRIYDLKVNAINRQRATRGMRVYPTPCI